MSLVIGHSQTKYLSEYFSADEYSVYSYPGYRTFQFLEEDVIFDVAPYFSVVLLVVGANDIGSRKPIDIVSDIEELCAELRLASPSATILVSEVLPKAQNLFDGRQFDNAYIDRWNHDVGAVDRLLHKFSQQVAWVKVVRHPEFHTMFGANRQLLSRDGLHLSYDGTETLTSNIEEAVRSISPMKMPKVSDSDSSCKAEVLLIYGPMLLSEIVRRLPAKQSTTHRPRRPTPVRKRTLKPISFRKLTPTSYVKPSTSVPQPQTSRKHVPSVRQKHINLRPTAPLQTTRKPATSASESQKYRKPAPSASEPHTYNKCSFSVPQPQTPNMTVAVLEEPIPTETKPKTVSKESSNITHTPRQRKRQRKPISVEEAEIDKLVSWINDPSKTKKKSRLLVGGGETETVELKHDKSFTYGALEKGDLNFKEAFHILNVINYEKNTYHIPLNPSPKTGSMFIYSPGLDQVKAEDWKADGNRWFHSGTKKKSVLFNDNEYIISKRYYL